MFNIYSDGILIGKEPLYETFIQSPPAIYWEGGIYLLQTVEGNNGHYHAVRFVRFPDSPMEPTEYHEDDILY